jgi:hypothetical protein
MVSAHRFSFEIHHGAIPDGLDVLHSCDNKPCVNPAHLRAGTPSENMREAYARGRMHPAMKTACVRGHDLAVEGRRYAGIRGRTCLGCAREKARARRLATNALVPKET